MAAAWHVHQSTSLWQWGLLNKTMICYLWVPVSCNSSGQDSQKIGAKNIGRILTSLPLYDMESVYVDAAALDRYGLNEADLVLPVSLLDESGLLSLLNDADHLVGC